MKVNCQCTASFEGIEECIPKVVNQTPIDEAVDSTSSGKLVETTESVAKRGPGNTGKVITTDFEILLKYEEHVQPSRESCKKKGTITEEVCKPMNDFPPHGRPTTKSGDVDGQPVGVCNIIGNAPCFVPQTTKIVFGTIRALGVTPPSIYVFEHGKNGTPATGDAVAILALDVNQPVQTVARIVQIVKVAVGTENLKAVSPSPLMKGLVKYEAADKAAEVMKTVKETVLISDPDGETQVDVVSAFEAGVSKVLGLDAVGQVNASTALSPEAGNTLHKSAQCPGYVDVTGLTSQGTVRLANDSLCGRLTEDAHCTTVTIVN